MMLWYEALLVTIGVILVGAAVIFGPFLLEHFADKIIEDFRRKKHPDYFKLYDTAIEESFSVGQEFNHRYDPIKFQFKMWTDGLKNGECTEEDFAKRMTRLTEEYQELCRWYKLASQRVNDLWKQVDLKAKELSFNSGIIYDDKNL